MPVCVSADIIDILLCKTKFSRILALLQTLQESLKLSIESYHAEWGEMILDFPTGTGRGSGICIY